MANHDGMMLASLGHVALIVVVCIAVVAMFIARLINTSRK
jgi:hypothetical protein